MMKSKSLKERVYQQYQILKNQVEIKQDSATITIQKKAIARETRQAIKWYSKGY